MKTKSPEEREDKKRGERQVKLKRDGAAKMTMLKPSNARLPTKQMEKDGLRNFKMLGI
jgi:hypothetical protein